MKILLTGAEGFVGQRIHRRYLESVIAAPSLRTMTEDDIRRTVMDSGADVIIHTAAISSIPACEADPDASYHANVQIPVSLAKAAGDRKLICFSSDQVYSGSEKPGPYREEDASPSNVYSVHKLEMENRVLDICPDAVMLRAEWMYDHSADRDTFFSIVCHAKEPLCFGSDQFRGVTWRREVADAMERVITLPGGAYNFGSETEQSMYEIVSGFAAYLGKDVQIMDVPGKHNLWMDCSKAAKAGVHFSPVMEGLKKCAEEFRQGSLSDPGNHEGIDR